MSLAYIVANAHSNVVMQASQFPPVYADKLTYCTVLDSTDNGVKDLLSNTSSHTFDSIMSNRQYVNVYYDNTNLIGTIKNPSANPPTSVNVSMLDQMINVPLANNSFTLPITIHPSVAEQRLEISVNADGCPPCYIEIGESNGNIPVQMYQDSNGVYHLIPQNNGDLALYWQNQLVNPTWNVADIATALGILMDAVFGKLIPQMQNASYAPLSLTTAEENGLNDIKTNILSNVASTLANIQPDSTTTDVHYSSYRAHIANANQAMSNYVSDRTEILKYTTLK
jgi:hypothetical protein